MYARTRSDTIDTRVLDKEKDGRTDEVYQGINEADVPRGIDQCGSRIRAFVSPTLSRHPGHRGTLRGEWGESDDDATRYDFANVRERKSERASERAVSRKCVWLTESHRGKKKTRGRVRMRREIRFDASKFALFHFLAEEDVHGRE